MAASQLQRWALVLAGYSYSIELKPTEKHGNADSLSRLPMGPDEKFEKDHTYEAIVCEAQQSQLDCLPVSAKVIKEATRKDKTLCKVLQFMQQGWDNCPRDLELTQFKNKLQKQTNGTDMSSRMHHGLEKEENSYST